jgi:NADH-quinone oxidoreductase subunit J
LLPAAGLTLIYLATAVMLGIADSGSGTRIDLKIAIARPKAFGQYLLQQHWLSIEIVSLLLLVALIGALHLGRGRSGGQKKKNKESI